MPLIIISARFAEEEKVLGWRAGNKKASLVVSVTVHVLVAFLLVVVLSPRIVPMVIREVTPLFMPDLPPDIEKPAAAPKSLNSGGGGGDRSLLPASKGRLPNTALRQFTPPVAVYNNPDPKLSVEPTIIGPPDVVTSPSDMPYGSPFGRLGPFSNGMGSGGGIGDKKGAGGAGPGVGPGAGPDSGVGSGGTVIGQMYSIGGDITNPTLLTRVDPEYPDAAREAKVEGTVVISAVIDVDGKPKNLKVVHPLGFGLEEKALLAVAQWRFRPSTKSGKPVAVSVNISVKFVLY